MRLLAPLALSTLLCGCFPSLDEYAACADGGCGGAPGSTTSTGPGGPSTTSSGGGATGAGGDGGGATTGSTSTTSTSTTVTGSSSGSGGGGGDPGCAAPAGGPLVQDGVRVTGSSQGTDFDFCIDRAEVTHEAYKAFHVALEAETFDPGPVVAARAECDFQGATPADFVPAFGDMFEADWDNTTNPGLPMVSVDWCDAFTYCAWAGKRLCGGIAGQAIDYRASQPRNEWYLACSNGDQRSYCYAEDGDNQPIGCINGTPTEETCPAYDPEACASEGDCNGWRGLWEESESASCAAFDPALVNLSGNVAEWIDACEEDAGAEGGHRCEMRGGSCPLRTYTSCHWAGNDGDNGVAERFNYTGFRCCWDPT